MRACSLAFLALASVVLLVTCVVPGQLGESLFAFLAVVFPLALIVLGASRGDRLGSVLWPVLFLAAIHAAALAGIFVLHHRVEETLIFGLPAGFVLQILGFFVLPLGVALSGYAWTFDRWGLRDEELRALRRRFGSPRAKPEDAS